MIFIMLRIAVFAVFLMAGYMLGSKYDSQVIGAVWGAVAGALTLFIEPVFKKISIGVVIGGIFGLSVGLLFANLLLLPLKTIVPDYATTAFILNALLGYTGLLIGLRRGKGLTISGILRLFRGQGGEENLKLLDTSVIIDGRIADVCEAGFIAGTFITPQFILQELQYIADSPDPLKRGARQERA